MFKCSQWLIRDNQETCFPHFIITEKHYINQADVNKDYAPQKTEYCFHPVKPIVESELRDELAERIYGNERK